MIRCVLLVLLLTGLVSSVQAAQQEHEQKVRQAKDNLEQVERQIDETHQQLASVQKNAESLFQKLQETGRKLRQAVRLLKKQKRESVRLKKEVKAQKTQLEDEKKRSAVLQKQLQTRLVALYKSGEIGSVRMLFSAQSPNQLLQDYDFMQRLMHYDKKLLASFRDQQQRTELELERYKMIQAEQQAALEKQRLRQKELNRLQQKQKQQLAKLRGDEAMLASILRELEEKAGRLNDLLGQLETTKPDNYTGTSDFAAAQGHLPWPVPGEVRVPFGRGYHPDLGTRYDSRGVEIAVTGDVPIRAVWGGRVAFAQAFRGFGHLLILDHGAGYYTLYAQASHLSYKKGDVVAKGDVVGYSGFEGNDIVYFEIRQGSQAVDPMTWLSSN
ncbi:MAG: hypothetical protein C0616_05805 [Desulfuromonas sp.]|nr:MAG: hypothetical protein C0616_05805 [Desulfuromonas sp.]